MLDEVQNVYRAQGVPISDKHIEVILRQMLGKVKVVKPGDTDLLPNDVVDKFEFQRKNRDVISKLKVRNPGGTDLTLGSLVDKATVKEANARAEAAGKETASTEKAKPAQAKTLLLGITKASLQSDSFLSGASFQETTKVLTEAALRGAVDTLEGLKENVLLGHLIPAGTGFRAYTKMRVEKHGEAPAIEEEQESVLEELAEEAEALGAQRVVDGVSLVDVVRQNEAAAPVTDADGSMLN
jgi:DNA-directed RNA polymerase subunit beta'